MKTVTRVSIKNTTLNPNSQPTDKPIATNARQAFDKSEEVRKVEQFSAASSEQAKAVEQSSVGTSEVKFAKIMAAKPRVAKREPASKTTLVTGDGGGIFNASELLKRMIKKGSKS